LADGLLGLLAARADDGYLTRTSMACIPALYTCTQTGKCIPTSFFTDTSEALCASRACFPVSHGKIQASGCMFWMQEAAACQICGDAARLWALAWLAYELHSTYSAPRARLPMKRTTDTPDGRCMSQFSHQMAVCCGCRGPNRRHPARPPHDTRQNRNAWW
jgi:hypothetical protein